MTATLFVADGGTGTCTQTSPCGSVQAAVSEGEGYSGEAVTVHVGPGTYTGGISVSAGSLASLTIEGSGASNTKVTGTTFLRGFLVSAGTEDASRRKGPVELLCDGPNPTPAAGLSRASLVGVQGGGPAGATTPSPAVASSDRSRWRARDCRRRDARTPSGRRDGGGPRGRSRAQPTAAGGEHE